MDRFAELTGRRYRLFEYSGHPEAERVIVLMGSGAARREETVEALVAAASASGVLKVRLFRPFDAAALVAALPDARPRDRRARPHQGAGRARRAAVPGRGHGARMTARGRRGAASIGGRYGLSSKEFTPAMVAAVFAELAADAPRKRTSRSASSTTSRT